MPLSVLLAALGTTAAATGAFASNHNAAPQPGAAIVGGAGTHTDEAGRVFAKSQQPLTLKVGGTNVACVVFDGRTDNAAPFEFDLRASSSSGLQSVQAMAYSNKNNSGACNQQSAGVTASYTVDNSAPQLSATLSPTPLNGWNKDDVTLTWRATDASGIKSGPTPATDSVTENTAGVTRTSEATDRLGTSGTGSQVVRLDESAPTISAALSPSANSLGWNNTDVSVSFACEDQAGLSGIAECPTSATKLTTEGAEQSVSGEARDFAGNSATARATVSIDKTPPTLAGEPQGSKTNGWHTADVEVLWTCADGDGSGVVTCPAPTEISGEGTGLTSTATIADKAGNATTATSSPAVRIDRTPPATRATAPANWTKEDAEVSLAASDGGSGVDATYFRIDGGAARTYAGGIRFPDEGVHSLEFWSVDEAGHEERHTTIDVKVDKTAPTIAHALSPRPNLRGWNKTDVTVSFVCEDAASGIASCTPDQVVSEEGASQQVEGSATDNAGNAATRTATVSLDESAPTIGAVTDREPNDARWYDDDVVVGFTCDDQSALSGVDECPTPVTVGAGRDQSVTRSVSDLAGNVAATTVSGINVDKRAPSIAGRAATMPNENGWYNDDVAIGWTCADEGAEQSGVAGACPSESLISGEGDALGTSESVRDVAGNEGRGSVTGIRIDRHAPVTGATLPEPVAGGWYGGPVAIALPAVDNLSGIASTYYRIDGGVPETYSGRFTIDSNGGHELTFWSVDEAGNAERPTTIVVKVDTANPTITSQHPQANGNDWYSGSVAVTFECGDADSGVKSCSDGVTLSHEGADQRVEGRVEDLVGNRANIEAGPINIDLTSPTVAGSATARPNAHGWYGGDVEIDWTCDDTLSGIDGSCPENSTIAGEGRDLGAGPASATDRAGNTGFGSVSGIRIDRTAPSVSIVSPADGATASGESATITVTGEDALSGVASVEIDGAAAGANADGSHSRSVALSCGRNTVSAVSIDRAGNRSTEETRTIVRHCLSTGDALSPLATSNNEQVKPGTSNLTGFKIRSVIPVKFRIYKDAARTQLMTTPPVGSYARLSLVKYDGSTEAESVEVISAGTANTDGLFRWSGSPDHQYVYNLATSGRGAGTYGVQLTLYGADGTQLTQSARQYFVLRS